MQKDKNYIFIYIFNAVDFSGVKKNTTEYIVQPLKDIFTVFFC